MSTRAVHGSDTMSNLAELGLRTLTLSDTEAILGRSSVQLNHSLDNAWNPDATLDSSSNLDE